MHRTLIARRILRSIARTTRPTPATFPRQQAQRAHASMRTGPSAGPPLTNPLNIPKWCAASDLLVHNRLTYSRLEQNGHLLQPPINNYLIYNDPMTVMIVGGPNARCDYHINETPEFFYQYKGRMLLKTIDQGKFRDIYIDEGELFLLPPNTPHNPVRFENTVGVVIEQPRPENSLDRLQWYCQNCGEKVHEAAFHCTDLGTQIKDAVNAFKEDQAARKCNNCGTICDVAPSPDAQKAMREGS